MRLKKCRREDKGFTLIEVMIVIAIIGILAAIAIPNFLTYRQRGYDAAANTDIKNAYIAAQGYFSDFKEGALTLDILKAYGYVQSQSVTLGIVSGTQGSLQITTVHSKGVKTYTVDSSGHISK